MAALVDEGKLSFDDRVRDHLPTFRLSDDLADREVRLRDLVCHRTGLATNDLLWYRAPWSPEEGVARLAYLPLARPFRTALQYNSVAFTAAGLAAARAAETIWPELIRTRLLAPLGMKRTCLDAADCGIFPAGNLPCVDGLCGCNTSSDCADGERCAGSKCVTGCDNPSDCPYDQDCPSGACVGSSYEWMR